MFCVSLELSFFVPSVPEAMKCKNFLRVHGLGTFRKSQEASTVHEKAKKQALYMSNLTV